MLSDYVFGLEANPFHRVYDPMDIRAGDVIAATSTIQSGTWAGRLWTADGNSASTGISWPDYQYGMPTSEAFQAQFNPGLTWEVWSRYPT